MAEVCGHRWATYYDTSDQSGQSRVWGGIHILADDFAGRIMGSTIGDNTYDKARTSFDGTASGGNPSPSPTPTPTPDAALTP